MPPEEVKMSRANQLPDDQHAAETPTGDLSPVELAALVARARAGDRSAFAMLFLQFNGRICTYLARLVGNNDIGRDLAQDTFVAVWRALPEVRDATRFVPWLYRIATNMARSHLRHARIVHWLPWSTSSPSDRLPVMTMSGPELHAGESELVILALSQLAPQHRTCLLLQVEAGFSQREIAGMLDISEKAVSAYVSRGREQFRRVYRQLECDSEHSEQVSRRAGEQA
jgi:RNA polymerase sigma-70 factor (ECF subfamily)